MEQATNHPTTPHFELTHKKSRSVHNFSNLQDENFQNSFLTWIFSENITGNAMFNVPGINQSLVPL